jgi:hypothetical protein
MSKIHSYPVYRFANMPSGTYIDMHTSNSRLTCHKRPSILFKFIRKCTLVPLTFTFRELNCTLQIFTENEHCLSVNMICLLFDQAKIYGLSVNMMVYLNFIKALLIVHLWSICKHSIHFYNTVLSWRIRFVYMDSSHNL